MNINVMKFFATRYAFKSIMRRKNKNLAGILAIALGVTLYVGVSIGSNGMEQALGATWWNGIGDTDITIVGPINTYMPGSIVQTIQSSNNPAFNNLLTVAPMLDYRDMPVYASGQFGRDVRVMAIQTNEAGYRDFLDLNGNPIDLQLALDTSLGFNPAIISSTMATRMNIHVDDVIQSVLPIGDSTVVQVEYKVTAIFDDQTGRGMEASFDREFPKLYTALSVAQSVLVPELAGSVNRINMVFSGVDKDMNHLNIKGKSFQGKSILENAVQATKNLLLQSYPNLSVWSERVVAADNITVQVDGIRSTLNIFAFLLNATALLLVVNVQSMSFQDRRYQTAVLRSMGSTKYKILRVFLIEAAAIGFFGAMIGLLSGYVYADFIVKTIGRIFSIPPVPPSYTTADVLGAIAIGVILSVGTALVPAIKSAGLPIASELRGLEPPKSEKQGKKTLIVGFLLVLAGLSFAQNVGQFWKKSGWATFDDQVSYLMAFGLTLAGIGMLMTLIIPRRLAMNISGFSIWGLALFSMFVTVDWVQSGNANNWFTIILLYLVTGSSMLVINNFDSMMRGINAFFMKFTRVRPISQVTSTQLIGKKTRATLVLTIFTLILVLNVFLISAAQTMRNNYVGQFEWRTYGNDIVVNTEAAPISQVNIADAISHIDSVEHVFSFRSQIVPITFNDPYSNGQEVTWGVRVIEVTPQILNPDNDWNSPNAFPVSFDWVMSEYGLKSGMSVQQNKDISAKIFNDLFNGKTRNKNGVQEVMTVGGIYQDPGLSFTMKSNDVQAPVFHSYYAGDGFSFLGDWDGFYGSILATPEITAKLPEFQNIAGPNLFLVKTSNAYADDGANLVVSQAIQKKINDLADPTSLSSQYGTLLGATTRIIHEEMSTYWNREASVWDFLATFAQFGLVIGGAGLAVIAVRSVAERTREIGMMRAIGFSRRSVVFSILYEMMVIGVLGVIAGLINGILLVEMFTGKVMGIAANYPIGALSLFSGIILGMSLLAAVLPSIRATRIAPSQALRYTG